MGMPLHRLDPSPASADLPQVARGDGPGALDRLVVSLTLAVERLEMNRLDATRKKLG